MTRCVRPGPERRFAVAPRPATTTVNAVPAVFAVVVAEWDATLRVVVVVGLALAAVLVGVGAGRAAAAPIPRADAATTAVAPARTPRVVIQLLLVLRPPASGTVPGGRPLEWSLRNPVNARTSGRRRRGATSNPKRSWRGAGKIRVL